MGVSCGGSKVSWYVVERDKMIREEDVGIDIEG
jgi:hypothetical protein